MKNYKNYLIIFIFYEIIFINIKFTLNNLKYNILIF